MNEPTMQQRIEKAYDILEERGLTWAIPHFAEMPPVVREMAAKITGLSVEQQIFMSDQIMALHRERQNGTRSPE